MNNQILFIVDSTLEAEALNERLKLNPRTHESEDYRIVSLESHYSRIEGGNPKLIVSLVRHLPDIWYGILRTRGSLFVQGNLRDLV